MYNEAKGLWFRNELGREEAADDSEAADMDKLGKLKYCLGNKDSM